MNDLNAAEKFWANMLGIDTSDLPVICDCDKATILYYSRNDIKEMILDDPILDDVLVDAKKVCQRSGLGEIVFSLADKVVATIGLTKIEVRNGTILWSFECSFPEVEAG